MKKLIATALIAAMSLTMLAGCGNSGAAGKGDVTDVALKVWVPQNQLDTGIIEEQQKAFAELHPEWNITWTTEIVGEDVAKENILRDVEAAADVFLFASDQLVELVNAGAIARLGGEAEKMVKETIAESVQATAMVGDAVYGIPFTHNTFYMYYDKTLMTEDDVKTIEGIVNKETADDVYNFYFESGGGWKLGAWYYGAGLSVFGQDGYDIEAGVDWNNETGVAVTDYLIDLINNTKVAYDGEISVSELIAEHRLGVWFDGSWNDQMYVDVLGDDLGRGVIPTYNLNGTDTQLKGFYSSKCIGVNAASKNMAPAVAFAAFLGNEENQILRFEKSGQIPANINAGNSDAVKADALATVIASEANIASVMQPTSAEFNSKYWNYANTIPTEIRSGDLTHDNVKEKLDAFVKAMTE
ncbi:MAG: extracellular solute-binding protein [Lachnospiraceae bacterium]|nr:extracellular solute-binding protein [Lachnospiraceae bacterium]